MADLLLDTQVVPSTPASGKMLVFPHSGNKTLVAKDDSGRTNTLGGAIRNWNTADVVANAADTYLTGSNLVIPAGLTLQVGTAFRWRIAMSKTAFGTAAPIWNIRVGTAGSVADSARIVFTQVALQTAAADTGIVSIEAVLRNVGASGILAGCLEMNHILAATGFSTLTMNIMQVTSSGFDTTVPGTTIGISVNPGSAGVWTHQLIMAEMLNI